MKNTKESLNMKFISLILSIFMYLSSMLVPSYVAPIPEIPDDDFVPVLRFVATSDTHIKSLGDTGYQRLSKLIKTAYAISDSDEDYTQLDAITFSGDITDSGWFGSFMSFASLTNIELREGTERLGVVAKAHDSYTYQFGAPALYTKITGQEADFHRVINGFHFIGISRSPTISHYTEDQREWLDKNLAEATAESPEKPVFVFQHEHVRDTVYGSSKSDGWGLDYFTDILEKYPQVIHISGHSHFPANDPRGIWQDSFTALNTGGLGYFELAVDGKNGQFPEEKDRMTQSLIIEVDKDNRVLVRVLDLDAGEIIREFLIDNVAETNKTKYNHEVMKANSSAPSFSENASLSVEKKYGMFTVTVPQATVSSDNEVFVYRLTVTDDKGKVLRKDWAFSDYFFADAPESISFDSFMLLKKATVTVTAEDVWGNQSQPLSIEIG